MCVWSAYARVCVCVCSLTTQLAQVRVALAQSSATQEHAGSTIALPSPVTSSCPNCMSMAQTLHASPGCTSHIPLTAEDRSKAGVLLHCQQHTCLVEVCSGGSNVQSAFVRCDCSVSAVTVCLERRFSTACVHLQFFGLFETQSDACKYGIVCAYGLMSLVVA